MTAKKRKEVQLDEDLWQVVKNLADAEGQSLETQLEKLTEEALRRRSVIPNKEVLIRFLQENWDEINGGANEEQRLNKIQEWAELIYQQVNELDEYTQIKDKFIHHLISREVTGADVTLVGEALGMTLEQVEQLWERVKDYAQNHKGEDYT